VHAIRGCEERRGKKTSWEKKFSQVSKKGKGQPVKETQRTREGKATLARKKKGESECIASQKKKGTTKKKIMPEKDSITTAGHNEATTDLTVPGASLGRETKNRKKERRKNQNLEPSCTQKKS